MNLLSTVLVALLAIVATPQQSKPDVKGSSDHPLFPNRMPGYTISKHEKKDFSSHSFGTQPPRVVEGKYTMIRYRLQDPSQNPGELAIHRNYENAIKSVGGQVLPSGKPYFSILKVTNDGIEAWIQVSTYYYDTQRDYILYIVERTPMQQVIKADATVAAVDSDHPLFPNRMPGYTISKREKKEFSSHSFGTQPPQVIEGKYTMIRYRLQDPNQDPGELGIHRNYENAIKSVGGKVLPSDKPYFSILKVTNDGIEAWVQVSTYYYDTQRDYILYIVERTPMQQVIRADAMAAALDKEGFVALDIHFATGKAEILPESQPIIGEIVSLLKNRPRLRIGVEGHTDNTGNTAANKTLSNARAKAVAEAIAAAGISSDRLEPAGYGQERPVADNKTEEGRAKNRRVELVKK
jgi:OmpA-OmpF porin, OOP family